MYDVLPRLLCVPVAVTGQAQVIVAQDEQDLLAETFGNESGKLKGHDCASAVGLNGSKLHHHSLGLTNEHRQPLRQRQKFFVQYMGAFFCEGLGGTL